MSHTSLMGRIASWSEPSTPPSLPRPIVGEVVVEITPATDAPTIGVRERGDGEVHYVKLDGVITVIIEGAS